MLRALRVVSVERGHDPRRFALVAFGGAGPLHACELAEELGSRRCSSQTRRACCPRSDSSRATSGATMSVVRVPSGRRGGAAGEGEADLRYRGQSFELTVRSGRASRSASTARTRSGTDTPTRSGDRAGRGADGGRPPGPEIRLPRASRSTPPARDWSSSPARPAGFPPGGWGLGMVRTLTLTKA